MSKLFYVFTIIIGVYIAMAVVTFGAIAFGALGIIDLIKTTIGS